MGWRDLTCPFGNYYVCHVLIALLIAVILWPVVGLTGGLAAGAFFYVGREVTQWEGGLEFDWKGFLAPVLVNGTAIIAIVAYKLT